VGSLLTRSPEVGISPPAAWKGRGTVVKTIGIPGGLGLQAPLDFEARVHAAAQRLIPQLAKPLIGAPTLQIRASSSTVPLCFKSTRWTDRAASYTMRMILLAGS
jgi:hypothetical protein